MEEQLEHDLKLAGEVIGELELKYRKAHSELMAVKGRILAVSDRFAESQISHGKFRDAASDEATKMAHAGSADAYAHAKRMVRELLSENAESIHPESKP